MIDNELTAPCGIDCSRCHIYICSSDDKKNEPCYPDAIIPCKGCRDRNEVLLNSGKTDLCEIYLCVSKKKINFCSECEIFPCELLVPADWIDADLMSRKRVMKLCILREAGLRERSDD